MSSLRHALALCAGLGCALSATASTLVPAGTLSANTTWNLAGSPYIVQGEVYVYGPGNPRLTIQAGVEVRFQPEASLNIASNLPWENPDFRGQLTAVGTLAQPILFTSDGGGTGSWNGLVFHSSADMAGATSFLQHCTIEHATRNLHLYHTAQPAALSNLVLRLASQEGLRLEGLTSAPSLNTVTVQGNGQYGILLSGCPLPGATGLVCTGNGEDRLCYTGDITGDLAFDLTSYPHPLVFTGATRVHSPANPRLTIAAGSELRFKAGASLEVGFNAWENNDWRGQLTAVGTPADPIVFTADNGLAGGWTGLLFTDNADFGGAQSFIQYAVIEKGVRNLHQYWSAQPAQLHDLDLGNASESGLVLDGYTTTPLLADLELHHNAQHGLLLSGCPLPTATGLDRHDNGENRLVYTGTISGNLAFDLTSYPHPLVFIGATRVYGPANPRLTIAAGSELRFKAGASLEVGFNAWENNDWRGQLTAVGTPTDPIVFTADNGLAGGWTGLLFTDNADMGEAQSFIQHAVIERGVRNLHQYWSAQPAQLHDLDLGNASESGLVLDGYTTTPVLADLELHHNAQHGLLLSGCPLPTATGLDRHDNGENRLEYTGTISGDLAFDLTSYPHPLVFVGATRVHGPANPRLTIAAGSELRFKAGASLEVGFNAWENNDWRGQLTAVGTPANPIVFTADNGLAGGWTGLLFTDNADFGGAQSFIQYAVIEKGVRNLHQYWSAQPAQHHDLELGNASESGLVLEGYTTTPVLADLELHHNALHGLLLSGCPLPTATGLDRHDNGENRLVYTGTISGDLAFDLAGYPHPLVFTGATRIYGSANPRLTIAAGSELRFKAGATLEVGYNLWDNNDWRGQLTAVGTAEQPIRFSADGALPGSWNGLLFSNNADFGGAVSHMEHCVIELATENLVFHSCSSPDTLANCTLSGASQNGLRLTDSYPLVANCEFLDNATAVRVVNTNPTTIGDHPSLSNSFLGTGDWYLYNDGSGPVNARYNGWCTGDGETPADLIHDQLDNPAKGLVTYLPTQAVDALAITARYLPDTQSVRLEWCTVQGALSYTIYSSTTASWPQTGTVLASTTDTFIDLPIATLGSRRLFFATAEITARGAGRSGGCR